jgi:hypothetical protein
VAPDHIFANDTIAQWAALFEAGHVAIFSPGIQVASETVTEALAEAFPGGGEIDLPIERIIDLMFRHLHPAHVSMIRGSPRSIQHPEYHMRALPGLGLTLNSMTSHAVAFRPDAVKLTDSFSPVDQLDRVAFAPCQFISAEPMVKLMRLYYRRSTLDADAINHLGQWSDYFFTDANIVENHITHGSAIAGALPARRLREATQSALAYVQHYMASRRIYRLWQGLRRHRLRQAARWVAAAHMHARLRRRLVLPEAATLYVPRDAAIAQLAPGEPARLVADGGRALIAALRAHSVPEHRTHRRGDRLAGTAARIVKGPLEIDALRVYVIDRPLGAVAAVVAGGRGRGAAALARDAGRGTLRRTKRAVVGLIVRHPGLHALVRRLRGHAAITPTVMPSAGELGPRGAEALALYRRAVAWRSYQAIAELYGFYQAQVLAGTPLRAVPAERLAALGRRPGDPAGWLAEAVALAPDFAEAWLELGHVRLERDDRAGAAAAFACAGALAPTLPRSPSDPSPRTLAAYERAQLLARDGDAAGALAALDAAADAPPPYPWRGQLLRARLLAATGQVEAALEWFEHALLGDEVYLHGRGIFPADLAELERLLETS